MTRILSMYLQASIKNIKIYYTSFVPSKGTYITYVKDHQTKNCCDSWPRWYLLFAFLLVIFKSWYCGICNGLFSAIKYSWLEFYSCVRTWREPSLKDMIAFRFYSFITTSYWILMCWPKYHLLNYGKDRFIIKNCVLESVPLRTTYRNTYTRYFCLR